MWELPEEQQSRAELLCEGSARPPPTGTARGELIPLLLARREDAFTGGGLPSLERRLTERRLLRGFQLMLCLRVLRRTSSGAPGRRR